MRWLYIPEHTARPVQISEELFSYQERLYLVSEIVSSHSPRSLHLATSQDAYVPPKTRRCASLPILSSSHHRQVYFVCERLHVCSKHASPFLYTAFVQLGRALPLPPQDYTNISKDAFQVQPPTQRRPNPVDLLVEALFFFFFFFFFFFLLLHLSNNSSHYKHPKRKTINQQAKRMHDPLPSQMSFPLLNHLSLFMQFCYDFYPKPLVHILIT